jgi:peptidoglycan/LPS O-acetylase OafA/YrhL
MHKHLIRLTPLRFLAAMCVVLFHFGRGIPPFDGSIPFDLGANAGLAVSFFFCLSGFIMASVYAGSAVSAKDYWVARVARIYPLYILAIVMTLMLGGGYPFHTILLNVLMLQAWVPGYPLALNAPGWSLSVEAFFYAIFPLLIGWISNGNIKRFGIISLCFWAVTQLFVAQVFNDLDLMSKTQNVFNAFPPLHLSEFFLGAGAGALFTPINAHRVGWRRFGTGALVLLGGVSATYLISHLSLLFGGVVRSDMGSDAPVFLGIIWFVASAPAKLARPLEWWPLVTLGEASYAIYLLQLPAKTLFDIRFGPLMSRLSPTAHLAAYIAFLIVLSLAVYLIIERPARRWIKGHFQNKDAPPAAGHARSVPPLSTPAAETE